MRGLLLVLAIGFVAASADAKKRFARKERKKCGHCHFNPQGGGARNTTGLYYQGHRELPSEEMSEADVRAAVDEWTRDVAATPPNIVWRRVDVHALPDVKPPDYAPVDDLHLLRRLSLDLLGALPRDEDVREVVSGERSIAEKIDEFIESEDFVRTFALYHKDLVRPRTGIFNKTPSLSALRRPKVGGVEVWSSIRHPNEVRDGACDPNNVVQVSTYWARHKTQPVCRRTADTRLEVDGFRCDTHDGQASGRCGCGPHLVYCYRGGDFKRVKAAMLNEGARLAMEVVTNRLPYSEIVSADWTMRNGRAEHYYARLDGRLGALTDADTSRKWRRVERGPIHAGVLSTHMYLNVFYNGRRWSQRTFETFMCHETTPDYDLLDDHRGETAASYRRHPTADADMNVNAGRACAACHLQLDGLARVKDRWDNFGRYYEGEGAAVPQTVRFLGQQVDGVSAFGDALGRSDTFADCAVNQLWSHMVGHRFQPEETIERKRLLAEFKASGLDFKHLVRAVALTDAYRARTTLKLMTRELYWRAMERLTGAKWTVEKRRGFDVFYDKVGGMDYRKIERRDRTPSQGHSLVQFKGAAETCDALVDRDAKAPRGERRMLGGVESVSTSPDSDALGALVDEWFRRIYVRRERDVSDEDRALMVDVFRDVEDDFGPADGYKALCTVFFASAEFAVY